MREIRPISHPEGGIMKIKGLVTLAVALLFPALAAAQSTSSETHNPRWNTRPKFEITSGVAMTRVFRLMGRTFGTHPNIGLGMEVALWKKLRFGAEINHTLGLSPTPVQCGAIVSDQDRPLRCIGSARKGVSTITAGSFTGSYFFGEGRVQPYLVGGLSILSATQYTPVISVNQDVVELSEYQTSDTGVGLTAGAGLRISLSRHISIRPEARFSDGSSHSRLNLSQCRISMSFGYAW